LTIFEFSVFGLDQLCGVEDSNPCIGLFLFVVTAFIPYELVSAEPFE